MDHVIRFVVEPLDRRDRVRVTAPLRFAEAIDRWQHDARFVAPALQHALWRAAAQGLLAELHDGPRWLSSSGLGVPWLHLRIDTRPKYYSHAPYRDMRP